MSDVAVINFNIRARAFVLLAVLSLAGCGSPEQRAQNAYDRATKLMAQQDYAKAAVEFKSALKYKRDMVPAWRGLAQIEEHNQNWSSLTKILITISEFDDKDIETRLKLARLMLLAKEPNKALGWVDAALALDDNRAEIRSLRGAILYALNDPDGSKREAEAALAIDPVNTEALMELANERLAAGDPKAALDILERPNVKATDPGIQMLKVRIFQQTGQLTEVERVLRQAAEASPKDIDLRRQLIQFYLNQDRPEQAETELRNVIAANPTLTAASSDLVILLQRTKGPKAVQHELEQLISSGGPAAFVYEIALAQWKFAQGDVNGSIASLAELVNKAKSAQQALAAQVKLAELHYQRKDFDAAQDLISTVLSKDARDMGALRLRALIHIERGDFDAAIIDARQALGDQPRSLDLMLLLISAYERNGSIELAEKQYADALKLADSDPTVGLGYAAFLRRRGSPGRAEDLLRALVAQWPHNVAVLSALADLNISQKNWDGALKLGERIRQLGNDRGLGNQIIGSALSGEGKNDSSVEALQSAYADSSGAIQATFALANALVRANEPDRALSFVRSIVEKSPNNAEAHVLLGSISLIKRDPEHALQSFRAAITAQPKNPVGYRALADYYLQQKNAEETLKVVHEGLQQIPNNLSLRLISVAVAELKLDYETAISEYESLLSQHPDSLIVANNLASVLSNHRTDKASLDRAYLLAMRLRKLQSPYFKDTLGWVYYQRGDYKNAVALLKEAAAELSNAVVVQYHLGMSYFADGQLPEASEQFKKALALAPDKDLERKIHTGMAQIASK